MTALFGNDDDPAIDHVGPEVLIEVERGIEVLARGDLVDDVALLGASIEEKK